MSNYADMIEAIKTAYLDQFPKGWIYINVNNPLSSSYLASISIVCGIQPREKVYNNIEHNDPARQTFNLFVYPDYIESTSSNNGLTIKTDKPHMYCETARFGYRKTKGNEAKIIKHFATYFKKCRKIVDEYKEKGLLMHDID